MALFLVASYLFYSSWGKSFLGILIASSMVNFAWGKVLRRRPTTLHLWIGLAFNLILLGVFKYLPAMSAESMVGALLSFGSYGHFSMSWNFYVLVIGTACGYFLWHAGADYLSGESGFLRFLRENRWWQTPLILTLTFLSFLLFHMQATGNSPFIYAGF